MSNHFHNIKPTQLTFVAKLETLFRGVLELHSAVRR